MAEYRKKTTSHYPLAIMLCGVVVAMLGAISFLGWTTGYLTLAGGFNGNKPMAPNSAIELILLGACLAAYSLRSTNRFVIWTARIVISLVAALSVTVLIQSAIGADWGIGSLLFKTDLRIGGTSSGNTSPVTALSFLFSCASFMIVLLPAGRIRGQENLASILAAAVLPVVTVVVLGYLFGTPLLYSGTILPASLNTAVTLMFLNVGLMMAAGKDTWLVQLFYGTSLRARLMRVFLPLSIIAVIFAIWFTVLVIHDRTDLNLAIASSFTAIILALVVSLTIFRLAKNIGSSIDSAFEERKQAEETILAQSVELEQYLKFFQGATDLMVTADPNGAFLKTNPACSEVLGYSEAELLNKPFIEFVHPDDKQKTIDKVARQQKIGDSFNFENRYVCKNGSIRWLSWRATTNQIDGLIYATARDVTEHKRIEEELKINKLRLDLAVEASQIGIWELDLIKDTSVRNLRHDHIFGYEEMMAEWGAKKFFEHIITEDRPSVQTAFDVAMKTDTLFFECRILWPDKSIHWITATGKAVRDSTGKPQKMFGIVSDITERKRAEAKMLAQSEEVKAVNSELQILNRITAEFSQTIDLDGLLKHALDIITDSGLFRIQQKGGIFIIEGEKLNLVNHMGHDDKFLKLHENLTFGDCLCGLAAKTGEIMISSHSDDDERHTIRYPGMEDHGHAIVPLKTANQVVGVLYLYLPAGVEINRSGRDLLQNIGSQLAVSIENAKLYEETKSNSLHDPLTGLANRSLMKNALGKAFAASQRTGRPVSVIMLDLDHFKKYNDTYGHAAGDRLLANVAALISREIRVIDTAVRYGGEEFLAILPETSPEPAALVAERIRKSIELTEFFLSEGRQPTHITVSLGVATYDVHVSNEDMLVARADAALYRAKNNGRNRVEMWLPMLYQDTT